VVRTRKARNSPSAASASSTVLEALRQGPKWAFRERRSLQRALAA